MSSISILLVILVSFLAGMEGILDEFEFHQPLISCTLIGLVTGHLEEGILLGGSLQLIALGWANLGASVAPDVCLASIISSILMVHGLQGSVPAHYVIALSIAIAIPLSLVGLSLTKVCRNLAVKLVHNMDASYQISKYHILGICMQGLRVLLPALILVLIPSAWVCSLLDMIPEIIFKGLVIGSGVVCVVGFAIVANVLSSKETWPFLILGFALAVTDIPMIILCMIGFAIMWMTMMRKDSKVSVSKEEDDPLGDIIDDYE